MEKFVWDPAQYAQFAGHRARPFVDLTNAIQLEAPDQVFDIGCGPGNMTVTLAHRWPTAKITGFDASAEMIDDANNLVAHRDDDIYANVSFAQQDAASWMPPADTDVVVSNAMFQWIPNHVEIISTWLAALQPGAWFAMQVPGNSIARSHQFIGDLAQEDKFSVAADAAYTGETIHSVEDYTHMLLEHSFRPNVWETTYHQVLTGPDPVFDWVKGAALRPVLQKLTEHDTANGTNLHDAFVARYKAEMLEAYPPYIGPDGQEVTVYPFRRIFVVGHKELDYFI